MKNLLLPICICLMMCFAIPQASAQVQKSDQNLGFGFDLNSIGSTQGAGNFYVSYTYFLTKNLSLGVSPRFGWIKTTSQSIDTTSASGGTTSSSSKTNIKGYNAFLNYSFLTNGGFVLPYFGAQFTKVISKSPGQDAIATNSYGVNIGIKVFLTERLNIDNNFSYTRMITEEETLEVSDPNDPTGGGTVVRTIDKDGSIMQLTIGLGYIIGRKN